jgi:hypothetical protein
MHRLPGEFWVRPDPMSRKDDKALLTHLANNPWGFVSLFDVKQCRHSARIAEAYRIPLFGAPGDLLSICMKLVKLRFAGEIEAEMINRPD